MEFNRKRKVFLAIVIVSLIFIFFVWRKFDAQTWERSLIFTWNGLQHFRKGLDVSGGTRLIYKISYDKYEKVYTNITELAAIKKTIENIILKNIDGRISKLGVSDYKAYVQNLDNQHYIVVEIWWIADLDQAKEIIGKTLELEFKLENPEKTTSATIAARRQIANTILKEVSKNPELMYKLAEWRGSENIFYNITTWSALDQLPVIYKNNIKILDKTTPGKLYNWILQGKYTTIQSQSQNWLVKTWITLNWFVIFRLLDKTKSTSFSWENQTIYALEEIFIQDKETRIPAIDKENNVLNWAYFKFANTSSSDVGEPIVVINLDDQWKGVFCNISEANVWKPMAIFVWWNLLTAPTIQTKICWWTAQINWWFTTQTAKELSNALNEWTLPAPLILMQEEKISPTLWVSALTWSLWAGLIWFVAICILIWCMYWIKKMFLTWLVLLSFLAVLAAFMKLTDYALSLSWIAAIILSIWMWVDANILIYERLREEIKGWKSISWAIDHAKDRSRPAIRDWQVSTGLIALLLFTMWTNMFKWFGSMMIVSLILTLFFNVPLTKELLHIFFDKKSD